ncbi:MAG: 3'-5' exonuclease [Myxococcota bacterium]|nr:3'-5' exonuclease [Myxococcota bacterium]
MSNPTSELPPPTEGTPWFETPIAIVDVETTGLDPQNDRVIEIGVVHMLAGEVQDVYSTLVNPQRELPPEVTSITGIEAESLTTAPTFGAIAETLQSWLEGRVFVAYNLQFDRAFVQREFSRVEMTWNPTKCVDPLVFVRELQRSQGSKRLTAVCERLDIPLDSAHRAAHDAEATGHVLYKLRPQLPEGLDDLILLQSHWAQQQENEMAGWRNRKGDRLQTPIATMEAADRGNALGPAYTYGDDTDPVRAMFTHLPTSGSRR